MTTTETLAPVGTAAAAAPTSQNRSYVILRKVVPASPSQAQVWEFVRNVDATSTEQAVRRAAEILVAASEADKFEATLVAVSARSFAPVTVAVETKTSLKLS